MTMTPCVEWVGARNAKGYGRRAWQGRNQYSHRVAWMQEHGPIPAGIQVMHICDNPPCVRLDHLKLGTNADNQADIAAKKRHRLLRNTTCRQGHPWDEENTYMPKNGQRACRACARIRNRLRRAA